MNLKEQIALVLKEHDDKIMKGDAYKTPEAKDFIIKQTHWVVDRLFELCEEIRGNIHLRNWSVHGRVPDNIMNEMLSFGQPLTHFLFIANLRDSITDIVEHSYGISFSGLRIHYQVTDKNDGKPVFILYNPRVMRHGNSYTLAKDGELFFVSLAEFDKNYS